MNIARSHFTVGLAGLTIDVNAMSPGTCVLCRHYLTEGRPDFSVSITREDIERERRESKPLTGEYYETYLENQAVYRKIVERALDFDVMLMHGAVVAVENRAVIFTGPSGTGKTTHALQWMEKAEGARIVNGDKPLIRLTDREAIACGTPWCGKEHMENNIMVPLRAIALMERGERNRMEEIPFGQAYTSLLAQTYLPEDPAGVKKTLALLARLNGRVRVFRFCFDNFQEDCFPVAYSALMGARP